MSYILDALKRSEQNRKSGEVPDLSSVYVAPMEESGVASSTWVLVVVLLGNVFFAGLWLYQKQANNDGGQQNRYTNAAEQPGPVGAEIDPLQEETSLLIERPNFSKPLKMPPQSNADQLLAQIQHPSQHNAQQQSFRQQQNDAQQQSIEPLEASSFASLHPNDQYQLGDIHPAIAQPAPIPSTPDLSDERQSEPDRGTSWQTGQVPLTGEVMPMDDWESTYVEPVDTSMRRAYAPPTERHTGPNDPLENSVQPQETGQANTQSLQRVSPTSAHDNAQAHLQTDRVYDNDLSDEVIMPAPTRAKPYPQENSSSVRTEWKSLPNRSELSSSIQEALPIFEINSHVFSSDPRYKTVMINGQTYHDGDALDHRTTVERITQEGIVLKFEQTEFKISLSEAWAN